VTAANSLISSRFERFRTVIDTRFSWWPYFIFGLLVAIYLIKTLGDGFAPSLDEGFLQSNAQRLLFGERPYHDFQYWRTPYSLYSQAFLIWLLGDSYTIMAGRILCALQLIGITVLLSTAYRRFVTALELFCLLTGSYIILSMLLTFPWYSYDALMFAVIAVVLATRKQFFWAGMAAAFSGLAKQNYFLLLPLLLLSIGSLRLIDRRLFSISAREIFRTALGFAIPLLLYAGYLAATGDLAEFYRQLVVYPAQTNPLPLTTIIFQDGGEALKRSLPFMLLFGMLFLAGKWSWWLLPLLVATAFVFGKGMFVDVRFTVYLVLAFNLLAALLTLILWKRPAADLTEPTFGAFSLLLFALTIQYLSGYNYSGLVFAQMGAAIAFPFAYITLKELAPVRSARVLLVFAAVALVGLVAVHKYNYVYHEGKRFNLVREYKEQKLIGVRSTPKMVTHVEKILDAINRHSPPDSYIFTYPDYPALYFLTGRQNPTDNDWYYEVRHNPSLLEKNLEPLLTTPPTLVLISTDKLPPLLSRLLAEKYSAAEKIDEVQLYLKNPIQIGN
jgi:hypothetical protein